MQIAALRKALGQADDGQDWILTVPRVGYRLVVPRPDAGASRRPAIPSLAVLPFANLGGDPEQDWFADGVVDDIITALSRFRSFAVVARNSSFVYKGRAVDVRQVARELGVRYVLEGSVRRAGDRLRITAQLVDGATGAHLWAEQLRRGARPTSSTSRTGSPTTWRCIVEPHDPGGGDRAVAPRAAGQRRGLRHLPAGRAGINKQTARGERRGLCAADPRRWRASRTTRCCSRMPPGRSSTAAPWAGRRSGRTTAQRCAELARRGAASTPRGDATVLAHCGMSLLQGAREYDWGMAVLESAVEANPEQPDGGGARRRRAPALRRPRPGAGAASIAPTGSAPATRARTSR